MNITLKPQQEKFLREKLDSGKYGTIDEVIAEAFKLLEERDEHYQQWLDETRKKVAISIEQANRGQLTDGKIAMARLREKLSQARGPRKDEYP
ncbi:MAG: type II toxin-antitoxin system ParD family antitoxin [Hormoscilla sp. SP12CHS1]|nr:type II toxin-antitoxin system ParD family antitoxin [Hormoscilla sp. SP12CHS1]